MTDDRLCECGWVDLNVGWPAARCIHKKGCKDTPTASEVADAHRAYFEEGQALGYNVGYAHKAQVQAEITDVVEEEEVALPTAKLNRKGSGF